MSEEDANKTGHVELFVPKTEISIWNSLIGLVIFIGLVLISPIFGTKLSQLLNRFGLLAQVLGLVSLVPEYFKEKLKGWNMQLAEWATSLEERRESIYYLKILWTESISKDERQRHIQNAHILIQIIAGL